jgi:large subunit ribosomal protein L5
MIKLPEKYNKEVVPEMIKKFGYKSRMAVPKIEKVVVNTGFGRLIVAKTSEEQKKFYNLVLNDLALICAQRPILTKAKKSIAGFKIREGMAIGAMTTLRGRKMYDFLERLIHIALPRLRDFRGIDTKSFGKEGNLTIAIKEHIVFPEVSPEKAKTIFGFEITVVTTAKSREEGIELLKLLGFPIKIKEQKIENKIQ